MNTKCWYNLNINVENALLPEYNSADKLFKKFNPDKEIGHWIFNHQTLPEIFSQDWLNYMKDSNLELGSIMITYRAPFFFRPYVHVDVSQHEKLSLSINWTIDNNNSYMNWFTMPTRDPDGFQYGPLNNPYPEWKNDEFTEVDRCYISANPVLVRIDAPHNIIVGDTPRWCMVARTWHREDNWNDAINFARDFIC
jgi:hypothetical protein